MPGFVETIASTVSDTGGLLITGTGGQVANRLLITGAGGQMANLLECHDSNQNTLCAIDPAGNLYSPSNGSALGTAFASSRHRMIAGRYTPTASSSMFPYGGPDLVALTNTSDLRIVQSPRAAMWQFHATDVQNSLDHVVHNVNVVQRYNSLVNPLTPPPAQGVIVTQNGSGYTSAPLVTIFQGGTSAHAIVASVSQTGAISAVTVDNHGSGYYVPPLISFESAQGLGASAFGTLSVIPGPPETGVHLINGGSNYSGGTTCRFALPQTQAVATATLSGQTVGSINVTNPGGGYLATPSVMIDPPPPGNTPATAAAIIFAGAVVGITMLNHGTGYTSTPNVTIAPPNIQAVAQAVISGGQVIAIQLMTAGAGYLTAPTVTIDMPPPGGTQRRHEIEGSSHT